MLLTMHSSTNTSANIGNGIFAASAATAWRANVQADRQHHRQQQEHPEQLDDHGGVADGLRHRVARADDLRDVVDGRAQHDAGRVRVEAKPAQISG